MTPEEKAKALALAKAKLRLLQLQEAEGAAPVEAIDDGRAGRVMAEIGGPETPGAFTPKSESGAMLRGFGQGASLGFGDELSGLAGALQEAKGRGGLAGLAGGAASAALPLLGAANAPEDIAAAASGQSTAQYADRPLMQALLKRYVQQRDEARQEADTSRAESPWLYGGSELAGMATLPMPKAKPLTSIGARTGQYAKAGAVLGGATSAGGSRGDIITEEGFRPEGLLETGIDTAMGAGMGGAIAGVLGPAMEVGAERLARPALKRWAESAAVKAVTPTAGLANRLRRALGVGSRGAVSQETLDAFGRRVLDAKVLRPLGSASGAGKRATAALEGEGAAIGDVIGSADELVGAGVTPRFSPQSGMEAAGRSLEAEAVRSGSRAAEAPAIYRELAARIDPPSKPFGPLGPGEFRPPEPTFRGAWQNKVDLQRGLRPNSLSDLGDEAYRAGVRGYTGNIYAQLEAAVGPEKAKVLQDAARKYGSLAQINDLLSEEVSRAAARKPIGLTEMHAAQTGGQLGGLPGAGIATALAALLRGRTASTIATGADALSRAPLRRAGDVGGPMAARYIADMLRKRQEEP